MFVKMQDGGICNIQNVQSVEKINLYEEMAVNAIFAPEQAVELFRGTEQECDKYIDYLFRVLRMEDLTISTLVE